MGRVRSRVGRLLRETGVIHNHPEGFTPIQQDELRSIAARVDPRLAGLDERLAGIEERLAGVEVELHRPELDVLNAYCSEAPSAQTAADIFSGEWASELPLTDLRAGSSPLFADVRVRWGVEILGGVEGQRVVELGPLEGGHTYMLDRMGAAEVVAVEANRRAFLRCLISKELLGMPSARFLCGDAIHYLESEVARGSSKFDLCVASGVLYHLRDPVGGLDLMTRASDRLLLWTHYYDDEIARSRPDLSVRFSKSAEAVYDGFTYTPYRQEYQRALESKEFCGGSASTSAWLTRADILSALDHFGFDVVDINFDEANGPNGPSFCVAAKRRSPSNP